MATREVLSTIAPPPNWVELPSLPRPQYINADGYSVDEFADEDTGEEVVGQGNALLDEDEENPALQEAMEVDEDIGEPLLSISESLVFVQSLKQSRQRNMQRLFPLIFTHPPLPSYQKPRARGPPKSTFVFPTPAGPSTPLPYREYHGPRNAEAPSGSANPGTPKGDDGKSTSAIRTQARAKRAAELDEVAPAHETECIARMTVTIGPFSYLDTELWIGRFVEPRAEAGKVIKADKKARMLAGEIETAKKRVAPMARPPVLYSPALTARPPGPVPNRPHLHNPLARPPPVRPPATTPTARPFSPNSSARPVQRPAEGAINPELIKKVNLAAATRPWLSDIIHKAARKQASQEELARLGRAVGRLNRGEDVDGGENSVAGPSVLASAIPARIVADNGTSRSSSPLTAADESESELSDLDEEASRKGPRQVGGGPIPEASKTAAPSNQPPPTSPRIPTTFSHFKPSTVTSQPRPPPPPSLPTSFPSSAFPRPPPLSSYPQHHGGPPMTLTSQSTLPVPPPPPRPVYPRVPPFLFIAFKDAPTEKYLLPLGSNSFISREGGDHVSHPRPAPTLPLAPQVDLSTPIAPVPPASPESKYLTEPVPTGVSAKLRTRASLGRPGKSDTPIVKVDPKPKAPTPEPREPTVVPGILPSRPVAPAPKAGTVTMRILMPTGVWDAPDWDKLEKGLPWVMPASSSSLPISGNTSTPSTAPVPQINSNPVPQVNSNPADPGESSRATRTIQDPWPSILNLGAVDLTPSEGDLQPATVHLGGLDDHAWARMKQVMDIVEMTEIGNLGKKETALLQAAESMVPEVKPNIGLLSANTLPPPQSSPSAGHKMDHRTYVLRKKARFARLLARAPARSFPRLRTEAVDPLIVESIADKWAPRPYSISTKSLYTRSPPPEDSEQPQTGRYSPEKPAKKRKSIANEPAVAFEMPVSLDALDEMVEEGARFAIGRRGKAGRPKGSQTRNGGVGRPRKSKADNAAEEGAHGQKVKRGKSGAVCEGCGSSVLKVWRKGPGGKGTLCKDCGDAYNAGTLGELKVPGAKLKNRAAASPVKENVLGERTEEVKDRAALSAPFDIVEMGTPSGLPDCATGSPGLQPISSAAGVEASRETGQTEAEEVIVD